MRTLLFTLLLLPVFSLAQDCKNYLFLTNNAVVTMTMYDRKGKESGMTTCTISNVRKSGGATEAQVESVFTSEKGKEYGRSKGVYRCEGGTLRADMKMSMPQQQLEMFKDAEARVDGAFLEYPGNLSVGQTLKDANFQMEMKPKGNGPKTSMSYTASNRKVEKKETVTSAAGSWEAYVITYDINMQTKMGGIGIPSTFKAREWFAPGVGVIKTESYAKGGKLMGSTLITSIKK